VCPKIRSEVLLVAIEALAFAFSSMSHLSILDGYAAVHRRRRLSLSMIRHLANGLRMPADILVRPYALAVDRQTSRKARRARAA